MKKAITEIMLAIMALSIISFVPNLASAGAQTQATWVRMDGNILNWTLTNGTTTETFGWIVANAAIVNTTQEWARVYADWSETMRAYPMGVQPLSQNGPVSFNSANPENFSYTFSFYTASFNGTITELSFNKTLTGHDFYLMGYWNVSEITETINMTWSGSWTPTWGQFNQQINITWTETPVATNANGTLVADWLAVAASGPGIFPGPTGVGTFALSIDGVGTLSGYAMKSVIWARELNICDFTGQGKVDINDLVQVAKHFGEAPGFANYDPTLDVNGEGRIGIGDLTTVAANIQG